MRRVCSKSGCLFQPVLESGRRASSASEPRKPRSSASWFFGSDSMPLQVTSVNEFQRQTRTAVALAEEEPGDSSHLTTSEVAAVSEVSVATSSRHRALSEVEVFIQQVQAQEEAARLEENKKLQAPTHPDDLIPMYRRIKRHAKHIVVIPDPDYPTYERKDAFVQLPPAKPHPWVSDTPIGTHIVHGDGLLGVVGTGEVGFDASHVTERLPTGWRGLQHTNVIGEALPDNNGQILGGDTVIKHSFSLTGRGVFATRDVKKGDVIMIAASTAQSLGLDGEERRLVNMVSDILSAAYNGSDEDRAFLHKWILNGQLSSLVERWPERLTKEVIERIGGAEVLSALELHPIHVARMASIISMNSFVVESSFDERRGMAYWPEAGYFNHSCDPNTTYEIMPDHTFKDSEYYTDEMIKREEESESPAGMESQANNAEASDAACHSTQGTAELSSSNTSVKVSAADDIIDRFSKTKLTAAGAPSYLFCARATKDLKQGEEILISYVPTEWPFDARQQVIYDRYRFRCKCPRCAPTLDSRYAIAPKFMLLTLAFVVSMQAWLMKLKQDALDTPAESGDGSPPAPATRLFDAIVQASQHETLEQNYERPPRSLPSHIYAGDPMAKAPR